jgi:hypothetical protein
MPDSLLNIALASSMDERRNYVTHCLIFTNLGMCVLSLPLLEDRDENAPHLQIQMLCNLLASIAAFMPRYALSSLHGSMCLFVCVVLRGVALRAFCVRKRRTCIYRCCATCWRPLRRLCQDMRVRKRNIAFSLRFSPLPCAFFVHGSMCLFVCVVLRGVAAFCMRKRNMHYLLCVFLVA